MQVQNSRSGRAQRGTTCIRCRRMKLRCDASAKSPAPCSRCARVGSECSQGAASRAHPDDGSSEDPWSRIAELERHLQDLRRSLQTTPSQQADDSTSETAPLLSGSDAGLEDARVLQCASQLVVSEGIEVPAMSLGDISIPPEEFLTCIELFYAHFHPQLPFLGCKRALILDSINCPLLAWALVAVAARVSPNLGGIHARLTWPVRRLASESILDPRSLPTIQALLILCLWPMPYAALIDDPSWNFSGIAIYKALRLGLHRPLDRLIQQANGDGHIARAMYNTWLVCFLVGHMQSVRLGIPSMIPPEHVNVQPQFLQEAPPLLRAAVELTRKDMVISSILSQSNETGFQHIPPSLRALGIELEDLDTRLQGHRSLLLDRMLCATKLRLYSFTLRCSSTEHAEPAAGLPDRNSTDGDPADLMPHVTKAYTIAVHTINKALEAHAGNEHSRMPSLCATWTFIDLQSFIMALFIALQISRRYRNLCDSQQVSTMMQHASSLLKSCSVIDGDHFHRVGDVINYLSTRLPAVEGGERPVEAESIAPTIWPSAGIGVAYDMVREAKKRYRWSVRFPESFPDLGASPAVGMEAGSSSVGSEAGEWLQEDPLMQNLFADFDFTSWGGWDGSVGFH